MYQINYTLKNISIGKCMYSSREIITCMLSLLIKRVTVMPNSAQSSLGSKCKHNPNEVKIAF